MAPVERSKYSLIELSVLAISDIIQELLKAHEIGKDLNLNKIKTQISSKYGLPSTPKVSKSLVNNARQNLKSIFLVGGHHCCSTHRT